MKRKAEETLEGAAAPIKYGEASNANDNVNGERVSFKRRAISDDEAKQAFRKGLFDDNERQRLAGDYASSVPYKHGIIPHLIDPSLLRSVRSEIQTHLSFTPKETDIYRIHQTGDLANLDGLDSSALSLLPSLHKLRDALYSSAFREYIASVANSGPLSGRKTDMAVNVYTPGCHLLCHDDVIGSRRLSYILYLTESEYGGEGGWRREWGGALRLYPTEKVTEEGVNEKDIKEVLIPLPEHTVAIPPVWNQLAFFAVQPGESFHDVEEVYSASVRPSGKGEEMDSIGKGKNKVTSHGDEAGDEQRVRMAISGWYHVPQEGEPGYESLNKDDTAAKSSLAQLQNKTMDKYDLPAPQWRQYPSEHSAAIATAPDANAAEARAKESDTDQDVELTESDLDFLIKYITPAYLTPDTVEKLADTFEEESCLQLSAFLRSDFADRLKLDIEAAEQEGENCMPGASELGDIARPPHKHRFLYRQPVLLENTHQEVSSSFSTSSPYDDVLELLFPSAAFRKFLILITGGGLSLQRSNIVARRFRRGKDYTLATPYEEDRPQLEVCLGITPSEGWVIDDDDDEEEEEEKDEDVTQEQERNEDENNVTEEASGSSSSNRQNKKNFNRSTSKHKSESDAPNGQNGSTSASRHHTNTTSPKSENPRPIPSGGHDIYMSSGITSNNTKNNNNNKETNEVDPAIYQTNPSSTSDVEDHGGGGGGGPDSSSPILFSAPPSYNNLNIVLRDKGVLRFTKYLTLSGATGDRWDVLGEWEVDGVDDDDDDGDDND